MHKTFYHISLIAFLILLDFSLILAQESVGPRIVLEERVFNAKDVKEGDTIEHTFKISNAGDKTLVIEKVDPG